LRHKTAYEELAMRLKVTLETLATLSDDPVVGLPAMVI
jgi:hypothetical protein